MQAEVVYTLTCRGCDRVFESLESYSYPDAQPLCPTCDALARKAAYSSPGQRQAAALELIQASIAEAHKTNEHLLRIGERIAAALERIAGPGPEGVIDDGMEQS